MESLRERYRHNTGPAHVEALFGRVVVLVEGQTEAAALPAYADQLGLGFDALGITVVDAKGKDNIEALHHLYHGLGFKVFVVFDTDVGGKKSPNTEGNKRLCMLCGLPVAGTPNPGLSSYAAVLQPDFEEHLKAEFEAHQTGLYERLLNECGQKYPKAGKPTKALYIADYLRSQKLVPPTIEAIVRQIAALAGVPIPADRANLMQMLT